MGEAERWANRKWHTYVREMCLCGLTLITVDSFHLYKRLKTASRPEDHPGATYVTLYVLLCARMHLCPHSLMYAHTSVKATLSFILFWWTHYSHRLNFSPSLRLTKHLAVKVLISNQIFPLSWHNLSHINRFWLSTPTHLTIQGKNVWRIMLRMRGGKHNRRLYQWWKRTHASRRMRICCGIYWMLGLTLFIGV